MFYSSPLSVSVVNRDIDTAAKFIGAGAATVGVAGSGAGELTFFHVLKDINPALRYRNSFRLPHHWLRPQPIVEVAALLVSH